MTFEQRRELDSKPVGLPIRSTVDLKSLTPPPRPSESVRNRLREVTKETIKEGFRKPYVNIRAEKVEDRLPLVAANITLRGLDAGDGDLVRNMQPAEMIWDTGAHHTTIAEEMLSDRFREYLQDPINEPYRSPDGVCLQLEATITFSNSVVLINAVAVIVPRACIPNQHAGILFGQTLCIDQLVYRGVP